MGYASSVPRDMDTSLSSPETLLAEFQASGRSIVELERENHELHTRIGALEGQNRELRHQLNWFRRQLFGVRSEKRTAVLEDGSGRQGYLGEWGEPAEAANEPTVVVPPHERKKRGPKVRDSRCVTAEGLRFGPETPVTEIVMPESEATRDLPVDQKEYLSPEISYRIAQHKSAYYVERIVRPVVKVKSESPEIHTAPLPPTAIPGSCAAVSFLAGLIVEKYLYHLPLYRIHKRLTATDIVIARMTLTLLEHKVGELLAPVYDEIHRSILTRPVIIMDETPRDVWVKSEQTMKKHFMWMLRTEMEVLFAMGPGRNTGVVYDLLGVGRSFVLVSDGYESYDSYSNDLRSIIYHACCFAHARRKFVDAEKQDHLKVAIALERYFQPLYRIEAEIREKCLTGEAKKEYRQRHARPLLDDFKDWLTKTHIELALLPKSPLAGACAYMLTRWDKFLTYLDHPDVPIDTNAGEREMRPHALGRNNWKVNMSEEGSEHVATFYSIIQSCTLIGVDPFEYLVDVLPKLAAHPTRRCPELTPLAWKAARTDPSSAGP